MRHDQPRRVSGKTANSTTAATSDRKLATCQPVNVAALMAAPPVENKKAAAASCRRWRTGAGSIWWRLFYGVGSVIRATHQRPRFHVRESHLIASLAEVREFFGRNITDDRQVPGRGTQILAQRENIHLMRTQVAHYR